MEQRHPPHYDIPPFHDSNIPVILIDPGDNHEKDIFDS
jgi:hypothetical protein